MKPAVPGRAAALVAVLAAMALVASCTGSDDPAESFPGGWAKLDCDHHG